MQGNTKKKLDSKIRFRDSNFQRKLQQARGYKRPYKSLPQSKGGIFLAKMGLETWWAKSLILIALFFLVYLIYIPNVFFIKQIVINSSATNDLAGARASINNFLDKKLPWPQKNLLTLNKSELENYLITNNGQILKVDSINKGLPNTLKIQITQRVDEFIIQTNGNNYLVSNDGLVSGQMEATSTLPNSLILIKLKSSDNLGVGQQIIAQGKINFIKKILEQISQTTYLELSDLQTPELVAYLQSGYKILFNMSLEPEETSKRLNLLVSQFSNDDQKKIYYIDMRFKDKSYVCYKGTSCVKDINLQQTPLATSTPIN